MGWVRRHGWRRCWGLGKVNVYLHLLCCCRVTRLVWCVLLGDVSPKHISAFKEVELYILVIFVSCDKILQEEMLGQREEGCLQWNVREAQPSHRGPQAE